MSIKNLPKNQKSFLAWLSVYTETPSPIICSKIGWTRQRYHTHIKQTSVFPRGSMASLASAVGLSYSELYKLEGVFYAGRQQYKTRTAAKK